MAEYLSPGVYVEEIDAGPKPIEGVSTIVTGAVGVTERGPTEGKPILVTSFNEYQQTFGGFLPAPQPSDLVTWGDKKNLELGGAWWLFPLAVKGFFDNGGEQLYVKRVYSGSAKFATGSVGIGLVSELTKSAKAGDTTLSLRHLFGISKDTKLKKYVAAGTSLPDAPTVKSYDATGGTVVVDNGPSLPLKALTDFVVISTLSTANIPAAEVTLTFSAQARGNWGNLLSVRVRPMIGATTTVQPDATAPVPAFNTKLAGATAVWTLTLKNDIDVTKLDPTKKLTILGKAYDIDTVDASHNTVTLKGPIDLADASQWQEGMTKVSGVDAGGAALAGTITRADATSWVVQVADPIDNTVNTLKDSDSVNIAGGTYAVSKMDPASRKFTVAPDPPHGTSWPAGTPVAKLRPARAHGQNQLDVKDGSALYPKALVELDNGTAKDILAVKTIVGNVVTFAGNLANDYVEGNKVRVIEAEVGVRKYAADKQTIETEESFPNIRLSYDDSAPNYIERAIKDQSAFVTVAVGPGLWTVAADKIFDDITKFPTAPSGGWQWLSGGDDAPGGLSVDDFVGVDGGSGKRTGIQALEDIDDISICVVPGMWSTTVRDALINHCETLKDRFAIVDPPDGLDVAGIQDYRSPIDTKYAALYYPWIVVRDPSQKRDVNVPPSGHMAGIYVGVDLDRGVHKAPANVTISAISKIAQDVNQREQDLLNPKGINALRFFPNRGNRVWGARTLSSDSSWKYINVRRLFIFVEKSIEYGTQWVVFEPNDEPLWSRVRQTIENFLTDVWRNGALQGLKPADAFFVQCDLGTTMTQSDIDNGRLIVKIGIAPVKPAEFVIFRIQQKTLEAQTS